MLFDDYNNFDEIEDDIEKEGTTQNAKHGDSPQNNYSPEQPSCMCMMMGIKIMKSAVYFENALADYLKCQCRIIRKLMRNDQYDLIDNILKEMSDTLHQMYNIESQIIGKIEKGAYLANCLEPEG